MVKQEIPDALKNKSKAVCDGITYTIIGCYLFYDETQKKLRYSALLLDKNGRSTCQVPIEFVEIVKE